MFVRPMAESRIDLTNFHVRSYERVNVNTRVEYAEQSVDLLTMWKFLKSFVKHHEIRRSTLLSLLLGLQVYYSI